MEVTSVRSEFPALQKCPDYVFGDAPTGTQCHASVAEAVKGYLENPGAHLMGSYPGAINTQATTTKARISAAAFFNCKPEEVCIQDTFSFDVVLAGSTLSNNRTCIHYESFHCHVEHSN